MGIVYQAECFLMKEHILSVCGLWILFCLHPGRALVSLSEVQRIIECPTIRIIEIRQNKGCWEVFLIGQWTSSCLPGAAVFCHKKTNKLHCRIMVGVFDRGYVSR